MSGPGGSNGPNGPGGRAKRAGGPWPRLLLLVVLLGGVVLLATESWKDVVRAAREVPAMHRVEGYRQVILEATQETPVDPYLLAGVMLAESGGKVSAKSHKGALGLFQLMPVTARERAGVLGLPEPSEDDLLSDPLLNARLGADYLSWLLDRSEGNVERALVAYNTGPTRLSKWIREAGSYEAWREERVEAGNSDVLAYAAKVARYRERFLDRGLFEPEVPVELVPSDGRLAGERRP